VSKDGRLIGKAIVVVGSATGIGAATVRRLADEGATLCLADINVQGAEALAAEISGQGGDAFALAIDLADEASVSSALGEAIDRLGGISGAHINAADMGTLLDDSDALAQDLSTFDRTLQVNLRGHLLCTRAVLPHMLSAGEGSIVYTSSGAAHVGEKTRPAYAVSKAGINALMRHVASRWGKDGITANCVAPGLVVTPEMTASGRLPEGFEQMMLAGTPSKRLGEVDDIAGVVAMLLSGDGRWINGQVLHVNGGVLMP
jgi:NAD(P)-dependent dehydrogenase (short-subunit alcohol dehydrogenase family)